MPTFSLKTNVPKSKIPKDFVKNTADTVAKMLGKPKSYVVVHVVPDQLMSWGGTDDPCALLDILSIGKLGREENKKHSAVLSDYVGKHLGIDKDRMYITFHDADKAIIGYNGTTFDDLL